MGDIFFHTTTGSFKNLLFYLLSLLVCHFYISIPLKQHVIKIFCAYHIWTFRKHKHYFVIVYTVYQREPRLVFNLEIQFSRLKWWYNSFLHLKGKLFYLVSNTRRQSSVVYAREIISFQFIDGSMSVLVTFPLLWKDSATCRSKGCFIWGLQFKRIRNLMI